MPQNIVIFASGEGSNAENLMRYFEGNLKVRVRLLFTSKSDAGVVEKAYAFGVPVIVLEKDKFYKGNYYVELLRLLPADLIILAGFLWKVPDFFVKAFEKRIINIHPSLLPKFGGKGMFGDTIHKAVLEQGECESGITIHYVNNEYDKGVIIKQERFTIEATETLMSLKEKIHRLEMETLPLVAERLINEM